MSGAPIVVLGTGRRVDHVLEVIRRLGMQARTSIEPSVVLEDLHPSFRLVVVVPPLPDLSAEGICRALRERSNGREGTPALVVGASPKQTRGLYEAGATGLFDWPEERTAFIRTLLRLAGVGSGHRNRGARDSALAARVEERLRAERGKFGPLLSVRVQRGVVSLAGEVDSLWKIPELCRLLSDMPGVEEVVTREVRVPPTGIPDRTVSRSVRDILRNTSGLEDSTFGVHVSNGLVMVTGTASSRREMLRVIRQIQQVSGVRGIENLIVVSSRAKHRDRTLAMMLSRLVSGQFPKARIDLSVFGRIAVLYGKAGNATERHSIESLVSDQPGVERVVSKVT